MFYVGIVLNQFVLWWILNITQQTQLNMFYV